MLQLSGLESMKHLDYRSNHFYNSIKALDANWLKKHKEKLQGSIACIEQNFNEDHKTNLCKEYKDFAAKKLQLESKISGYKILKCNTRRLSMEWNFLKPLYNLRYRPLLFSKIIPILCSVSTKQRGTMHISKCHLTQAYLQTI